ncbi:hypothetical protein C8R44DRAFT_826811, partial [Mycena epipterygia]
MIVSSAALSYRWSFFTFLSISTERFLIHNFLFFFNLTPHQCFFHPLVAVALLCIAPLMSLAAPIPEPELGIAERGIAPSKAAARPPTAQQMINGGFIDTPRTNKAFFWSGPNPQPAGLQRLRVVATNFAEANDFDYVGSMLTAKGPRWSTSSRIPKSRPRSRRSSGTTRARRSRSSPRAKSRSCWRATRSLAPPPKGLVFEKVEAPVLEQRKAAGLVTSVVRIGRDFAKTKISTRWHCPC